MTKKFYVIAGMVLAGLAGFGPVAKAASLDGTWHVTGQVSDNPVNPTCVLVEADGKLSGTCTGTDGAKVKATGTVAEGLVKFEYGTTYQGGAITISFSGKLAKDGTMAGTIYVPEYSVGGDFTAKKD
jgi:hypothetical protein